MKSFTILLLTILLASQVVLGNIGWEIEQPNWRLQIHTKTGGNIPPRVKDVIEETDEWLVTVDDVSKSPEEACFPGDGAVDLDTTALPVKPTKKKDQQQETPKPQKKKQQQETPKPSTPPSSPSPVTSQDESGATKQKKKQQEQQTATPKKSTEFLQVRTRFRLTRNPKGNKSQEGQQSTTPPSSPSPSPSPSSGPPPPPSSPPDLPKTSNVDTFASVKNSIAQAKAKNKKEDTVKKCHVAIIENKSKGRGVKATVDAIEDTFIDYTRIMSRYLNSACKNPSCTFKKLFPKTTNSYFIKVEPDGVHKVSAQINLDLPLVALADDKLTDWMKKQFPDNIDESLKAVTTNHPEVTDKNLKGFLVIHDYYSRKLATKPDGELKKNSLNPQPKFDICAMYTLLKTKVDKAQLDKIVKAKITEIADSARNDDMKRIINGPLNGDPSCAYTTFGDIAVVSPKFEDNSVTGVIEFRHEDGSPCFEITTVGKFYKGGVDGTTAALAFIKSKAKECAAAAAFKA